VSETAAQAVPAVLEPIEHLRHLRMFHRATKRVRNEVLLAHISDVGAILILGEKMVEGLLPIRADAFGNGGVPFLAVRENRIDIEHHAAKIEDAVAHHFAQGEVRTGMLGRFYGATSLRREELSARHWTA
jgi:hypothetical protein